MSAERLREAALNLRRLVNGATPGSWQTDGPFWWRGGHNSDCTTVITAGDDRLPVVVLPEDHDRRDTSNGDAKFIATMQPSVARALAHWLEAEAFTIERADGVRKGDGSYGQARLLLGTENASLALAHAVIGERFK